MKHTQVKWHYYSEGNFNFGIGNDTGRHIADISKNANIPTNEKKANAKLIAAAPELLFSLQMLVNDIERNDGDIINLATLIKEAKEAIKKATQ